MMNIWVRPSNWDPNYGYGTKPKPEDENKMSVAYGSSCSLSEIANMGYGELDGKKLMIEGRYEPAVAASEPGGGEAATFAATLALTMLLRTIREAAEEQARSNV